MKKKLYFNLLVDISPILARYVDRYNFYPNDAKNIKKIFEDRYEIWKYIYNKETKCYEIDSTIVAQTEDIILRIDRDPRLNKIFGYNRWYRSTYTNLQDIRHFSSIEAAQLVATIENVELFMQSRKSDSIPNSISFGEILKKWKRIA